MAKYFLFTLLSLCILTTSAEARLPISFGDKDRLAFLQDVELKGADNEDLFLGKHLSAYSFLGGVSLTDKGYVLGVKKDKKTYYALPEGDELKQLQDEGLLPHTFPEYELSFDDYLFGYGLYIFLLFMALYMICHFLWTKIRPPKEEVA